MVIVPKITTKRKHYATSVSFSSSIHQGVRKSSNSPIYEQVILALQSPPSYHQTFPNNEMFSVQINFKNPDSTQT